MKFVFAICVLLSVSVWSGAQPVTAEVENRAVKVKFMGGFTGFDADAYRMFRAGIASLLVDGVVDHFITTSWGHEGGGDFCVELNPEPLFKLTQITNMLAAIKPGKNTIYEYSETPSCLMTSSSDGQ